LDGVRLAFGYRITNQTAKRILEAETVHVCASVDGKPRRLPPELKDSLAPFLMPSFLLQPKRQ
jgi:acyl-CoA thioesterase FadM